MKRWKQSPDVFLNILSRSLIHSLSIAVYVRTSSSCRLRIAMEFQDGTDETAV